MEAARRSITVEQSAMEESVENTFLAEFPPGEDIFSDDDKTSSLSADGTIFFRHDFCPDVPLLRDLDDDFAAKNEIEKRYVPDATFDLKMLLEVT